MKAKVVTERSDTATVVAIQKARFCPLWFVLPWLLTVASNANAEVQPLQDWQAAKAKIENRLHSIKTLQAYLHTSVYTTSSHRQEQIQVWGATLPQSSPQEARLRFDPNQAVSYRWMTDGTRWRCERNYNYPVGKGYYVDVYGGEVFTYYRQDTGRAWIAPKPTYDPDALTDLQDAKPLGFDFLQAVQQIESGTGTKAQFAFGGVRTISQVKCSLFRSMLAGYQFAIWVDGDSGVIMRSELSFSNKNAEGRLVYQVTSASVIDGIIMPKSVQIDSYAGPVGAPEWFQSLVFNFDSIELNQRLTDGDFRNVLRVGTVVENQIENPGSLVPIGGPIDSEEVRRVMGGTAPPLLPVVVPSQR